MTKKTKKTLSRDHVFRTKEGIKKDLQYRLLRNHGETRLGTHVGRVAKIGQSMGLDRSDIVEALVSFWTSKEGIAKCEELIVGAFRFGKENSK